MEKQTGIALKMTESREKSTVFGAVVFVMDDNNKTFVIREESDKPETERKSGEYGVFCETRNDEGWAKNIRRALIEETGISESRFGEVFDFSNWVLFETAFVEGVWATVYKIRCKDPNLFTELFGNNRADGVTPVGWKTLDEFENLRPLRPGVENILKKYKVDIFGK